MESLQLENTSSYDYSNADLPLSPIANNKKRSARKSKKKIIKIPSLEPIEYFEDEVKVDGRIIKKDVYPEGFDFNYIQKSYRESAEPVVNYNNLLMDHKLVDFANYKV